MLSWGTVEGQFQRGGPDLQPCFKACWLIGLQWELEESVCPLAKMVW